MDCPLTGLGVNVHQVAIPTPATVFPYFNWVRYDDPFNSAQWSTTLGNVAAYRSAGFKICYLLSSGSYGTIASTSNIVGLARDVLIRVQPDALELFNEPDLNGISASDAATVAERIFKWASKHAPSTFILSPAISMIASGSAARQWLTDFIAAGGLQWVNGVAVHPYPWGSRPSAMAAELLSIKAQIGDLPLVCTEVGPITKLVEDINGGQNTWTVARAAAWLEEMRVACATADVPWCVYDGPASVNIDGYNISTTCSAAASSATQTLASTTGIFAGQRLFFSVANTIRTVTSLNGSTVTLNASVSTSKNEPVYSWNQDMALTDFDTGGSPPANKSALLTAFESHLAAAGLEQTLASDD